MSEWYICFGNRPVIIDKDNDYYRWRLMLISTVDRKIVWEGVNMETHCWFANLLVNCQFLLVYLWLTVSFRRVWCAALPSCGIRNTKSYLRSSRTPVILKANEHGYDSITVLQYWKTIPTAKQNKMNCILMRNVTLPSWYWVVWKITEPRLVLIP